MKTIFLKTIVKIAAAAFTVVILTACDSGSGSGSSSGSGSDNKPISAEHQEMIDKAIKVASDDGLAACTAESINTLYFVAASGSFKTCVNKGEQAGYGYVDVSVDRSSHEGSEQILSFHSYRSLPYCGCYTRNMVAYVASQKKLKYCGLRKGYRWWRTWQDVDVDSHGSSCAITANDDGTKTVTCGKDKTVIADGKDGADGADGADGQDGADGADGAAGAKGAPGTDGADGAQGPQGDKGEQGAKGSDGAKGPQGDKGEQGQPGTDGAQGPQGDKGEQGQPGTDGAQGPQGDKGEQGQPGTDGAQGPQGDKGEQGAKGSDGAQGPRGDKGEKGDKGNDAPDSAKGPKGEQGEKGETGEQGDKGQQGDAGADGEGCQLSENADGSHTLTCGSATTIIGKPRPTFVQMSSGVGHTCGISKKAEVWCWGRTAFGQLGRNLPMGLGAKAGIGKVPGLTGVKKLASGYNHSCALTQGGEVYCWGHNNFGQTGVQTSNDIPFPSRIAGFSGAKDIAAAARRSCAIGSDSQVRCVGEVHLTSTALPVGPTPTVIPGLSSIFSLAVGEISMCGIAANGNVLCRGFNRRGELGQQPPITFLGTPAAVPGVSGIQQLASGVVSYCALDNNQKVICWGHNDEGQMGLEPPPQSLILPRQIAGLASTKAIHGGNRTYCATSTTGDLRCWGRNLEGQLGSGSNSPIRNHIPQLVLNGLNSPIEDVFYSASTATPCVKTADRRITCWGRFFGYPKDMIPTTQPALDYGPWELDLSGAGL